MSVRVLTRRPLRGKLAPMPSARAAVGLSVVALIAACLFAGLADQVADHQGVARSDVWLLHDIVSARSGALTAFAKVVTNLGSAAAYLVLAGAGLYYSHKKHSFVAPVAALLWMAGGLLLRLDVSRMVARPRPPQDLRLVGANGFAFPSGHTATATIGLGLTALLLGGVLQNRRWLIGALALLTALVVGVSRSYLGVHWPSDVLAGWTFGTAWVALGALMGWFATRLAALRPFRTPSVSNFVPGGRW